MKSSPNPRGGGVARGPSAVQGTKPWLLHSALAAALDFTSPELEEGHHAAPRLSGGAPSTSYDNRTGDKFEASANKAAVAVDRAGFAGGETELSGPPNRFEVITPTGFSGDGRDREARGPPEVTLWPSGQSMGSGFAGEVPWQTHPLNSGSHTAWDRERVLVGDASASELRTSPPKLQTRYPHEQPPAFEPAPPEEAKPGPMNPLFQTLVQDVVRGRDRERPTDASQETGGPGGRSLQHPWPSHPPLPPPPTFAMPVPGALGRPPPLLQFPHPGPATQPFSPLTPLSAITPTHLLRHLPNPPNPSAMEGRGAGAEILRSLDRSVEEILASEISLGEPRGFGETRMVEMAAGAGGNSEAYMDEPGMLLIPHPPPPQPPRYDLHRDAHGSSMAGHPHGTAGFSRGPAPAPAPDTLETPMLARNKTWPGLVAPPRSGPGTAGSPVSLIDSGSWSEAGFSPMGEWMMQDGWFEMSGPTPLGMMPDGGGRSQAPDAHVQFHPSGSGGFQAGSSMTQSESVERLGHGYFQNPDGSWSREEGRSEHEERRTPHDDASNSETESCGWRTNDDEPPSPKKRRTRTSVSLDPLSAAVLRAVSEHSDTLPSPHPVPTPSPSAAIVDPSGGPSPDDLPAPPPSPSGGPASTRRFFCSRCPKRFQRLYDLHRHHSTIHSEKRPFTCPVCGAGFARKDSYRCHMAAEKRAASKGRPSTRSRRRAESREDHQGVGED
ncbi:hypothetical protein HDU96_000442 [Phlyctochytrium bullatum]|nr:hypothetical protein HDU96_000442 [Phlyctochytrium bullatum]